MTTFLRNITVLVVKISDKRGKVKFQWKSEKKTQNHYKDRFIDKYYTEICINVAYPVNQITYSLIAIGSKSRTELINSCEHGKEKSISQ